MRVSQNIAMNRHHQFNSIYFVVTFYVFFRVNWWLDNFTKIKRWDDGISNMSAPKREKLGLLGQKSKAKAVARYKEIIKEQILMFDNPSIGATPFKTIIELFIAERRDDVRNSHLREATMAGYEIHVTITPLSTRSN